jgi:hypothetical protein
MAAVDSGQADPLRWLICLPTQTTRKQRDAIHNTHAQSCRIDPPSTTAELIFTTRHTTVAFGAMRLIADSPSAPGAAWLRSLSPASRGPSTTAAPRPTRVRTVIRVAVPGATAPLHAIVGASWGSRRPLGYPRALQAPIASPPLASPSCLGGVEGLGSAKGRNLILIFPRTFNLGPPAPQASAATAPLAEAHAQPAKVYRAAPALGATATNVHVRVSPSRVVHLCASPSRNMAR